MIYSVIPMSDKKPRLRVINVGKQEFEIINGVCRINSGWMVSSIAEKGKYVLFLDSDYNGKFGNVAASYKEAMLARLEKYPLAETNAIKRKQDKKRDMKLDRDLPIGITYLVYRSIGNFYITGFDGAQPKKVYVGKYPIGSVQYNEKLKRALVVRESIIKEKLHADCWFNKLQQNVVTVV